MKSINYCKITVLMIALLLSSMFLVACDIDVTVQLPSPPPSSGAVLMTVASCEPPMPPSVEESCFYAHDDAGNLYRVNWSGTREIREGSEVYVDFDSVRQLTYENGYPSGWNPQYEVIAKSVTLHLPFTLPDFEEKDVYNFGWGAYTHVYDEKTTYTAVKKYVNSLEKDGFSVYSTDGGDSGIYLGDAYLLYRENITILIEKSDYVCALRYHISNPPVGNNYTPNAFPSPTSDEILAMLGNETGLYAFEVTPRELHNATGARLYEVVTEDTASWWNYSSMQALRTNLVLVGENGILPLHCSAPEKLHVRDMNGDGITEIYYISGGSTSGVWSEIINVLEIKDGIPTAKAVEMVSMRGDFSFVDGSDGQLLLRETHMYPHENEAPTDFEFTVEEGHIFVTVNGDKQALVALHPKQ